MRCAALSRPGSLGAGRRDAVGGDHAADRWLELLEVTQQGLEEQRRRSRCRTTSTTPPKAAAAPNRRLERRQATSRRRRSAHRLAAEEQLSVCQGGHAARAEPRRAGAQAARAAHSEAEHAGKRAGAWARACAPNPEPPRPGVHFFLSGIRPFHHHHHPTKPERTKTPGVQAWLICTFFEFFFKIKWRSTRVLFDAFRSKYDRN